MIKELFKIGDEVVYLGLQGETVGGTIRYIQKDNTFIERSLAIVFISFFQYDCVPLENLSHNREDKNERILW